MIVIGCDGLYSDVVESDAYTGIIKHFVKKNKINFSRSMFNSVFFKFYVYLLPYPEWSVYWEVLCLTVAQSMIYFPCMYRRMSFRKWSFRCYV